MESRRPLALPLLAVASVLLLVVAVAGARFAVAAFTARSTSNSALSSIVVAPPSGLQGAADSAGDVGLKWTASTNATGYQAQSATATATPDCAYSGTSYSNMAATGSTVSGGSSTTTSMLAVLTPSATTVTCVRLLGTDGSTFDSNNAHGGNPTFGVSPSFVASSVSLANGGVSGTLDAGDTITITYSHPVSSSLVSGASNVCVTKTSGVIHLGDSKSGTLSCNDALGTITPVSCSGCGANTRWAGVFNFANTTVVVNGVNTTYTTVTITIPTGGGSLAGFVGPFTYAPAAFNSSDTVPVAITTTTKPGTHTTF